MAGIGPWRQQMHAEYADARKWGTGIHPIHAQTSGYEARNNVATIPDYIPNSSGFISHDFASDPNVMADDFSWMSSHPNWAEPNIQRARTAYPSWGEGPEPTPQGTRKRLFKEGFNPRETSTGKPIKGKAGEGWLNKVVSFVLNAGDSSPEQLTIRTSHRQRDAVRTNNAAITRGTDAPREPIQSRIVGMRERVYSGGIRHEEMTPRTQEYRPRPFQFRTAGTGPRHYNLANEQRERSPITRTVPADVYTGPEETELASDDFYDDWD